MDGAWFSKIESRIFTILKNRMRNEFPSLHFTTVSENVNASKFPMLYLHELEQVETGNDLTNTDVNAIICTIQIQVYAKNAADCKEIMTDAVLQMKRLMFNVPAMPIYSTANDKTIFLASARFRRVIGGGDLNIVKQD